MIFFNVEQCSSEVKKPLDLSFLFSLFAESLR